MTSGAATMLGPGRRRHRARARRARRARPSRTLLAHAAGWGARTIEVGPARLVAGVRPAAAPGGRRARSTPRSTPSRRSRCSRSRWPGAAGRRPRPPGLDRALPQPGPSPHPDRRRGGSADPDRARRRGQRRVHAQPARRHPDRSRRCATPSSSSTTSTRTASGRPSGWRPGPPGRSAPSPAITAHLERPEALAGADFVINTIQVGGARATQVDFDIPARHGLRYTINDTINVGGVLRGLRTIPVVLGIARDMTDACPDATLLNYTNPMGMLVRAVDEAVGIPTVGLCHSVYWTVDRLAGYVGVPAAEVDALSAGVNHLAWILRLEHRGARPLPGAPRVRRGRPRPRRRPRPGRPLPAVRLVPDRVLGAPRRVQPVVHPQGQGRAPSTSRSASTSRGSRTTSTSTRRRGAASTPASRSRSSAAASTPR